MKNSRVKILVFSISSTLVVVALIIYLLYQASFQQNRQSLLEVGKAQSRLIEAVAHFDAEHSQDARAAATTIDADVSYRETFMREIVIEPFRGCIVAEIPTTGNRQRYEMIDKRGIRKDNLAAKHSKKLMVSDFAITTSFEPADKESLRI